ncbi:hypothetical protein LEP1GSC046_2646 [Leptospira kirschneri serovar Bim str. 1051]|nr:hypothetical protein LEP1GSC042_0219 [Leptospira kirschneri serovar Bim str. PUO 1247]EMN05321.1 hypothetical protein LEP1GSC046_2646 [Leptospira kirschneri serovar Bim str. 1051]
MDKNFFSKFILKFTENFQKHASKSKNVRTHTKFKNIQRSINYFKKLNLWELTHFVKILEFGTTQILNCKKILKSFHSI